MKAVFSWCSRWPITPAATANGAFHPEPRPLRPAAGGRARYHPGRNHPEINAYTRLPHRQAGLHSLLHQHIQDEFARAGVEIMSPHYRATRIGAEASSTTPPLSSQAPPLTGQP